MKKKKKVLITALGTMNCTTIINELRKTDFFYLIGADINPKNYIANSKYVDEFYVFPKVTENRDAYFIFIKNFCQKHKIDILYCVVDEEVALLSRNRKELKDIGVVLCVADDQTVQLCHDKNVFSDWVEKNVPHLKIKRFKKPTDISSDDYPLFIKPKEGRASIGCAKISNASELDYYLQDWNNYVVQEFIDSPILAVDIVSNRYFDQVEISQRIELLRNGNGCGIAVKIINDLTIRESCLEIVEKMKLNGVVNAEFFLTDDGPKIIEINPRIPAGVEYSCLSGLNVVMNALHIAQEEPCEFNIIQVGSYYTKRYETIVM